MRGLQAELKAGFLAVERMMVCVLLGPGWALSGHLLPITVTKEAQGRL